MAHVLGVFTKVRDADLGAGGTRKSYEQKTYWFVRRLDDDTYEVQPLNAANVPSGIRSVLAKGEFMRAYAPEPDYYERKTLPVLQSLKSKVDKGEKFLADGQLDDAESEFLKAVLIDENSPPANMGLGQVYCHKNDHKKLKAVVDRLLNLDEAFTEEQRHRFNSFGINLRRGNFLEEAVRYYQKALDMNPGDENLHFNIARAYFEMRNIEASAAHLHKALKINPDFREAAAFLRHCRKALAAMLEEDADDAIPAEDPGGKGLDAGPLNA